MSPRSKKKPEADLDLDDVPGGGRVPYHIKVPRLLSLRIERLLGVRMLNVVAQGGRRGDASATALFEEAVEALLDREEKALDLNRTHPLPVLEPTVARKAK